MFSFPTNESSSVSCAFPVIKETVPASSLGYKTNNKYPHFPPIMSDGRAVTSTWQPESTINADLIQRNGIQSNWQYRKFLTDNAKSIMEYNFLESSNDVGYYKRPIDVPNIQSNVISHPRGDYMNNYAAAYSVPYLYSASNYNSKPKGYMPSDLKDLYFTREELESRKFSPVITQESILRQSGK